MSSRRLVAMTGAALAGIIALSSCSSGSGSGTGSTGSAKQVTAASSAGLARATADLDKLRAVPAFTAPGPGVDVPKLRGKHIFVIPIDETPAGTAIEDEEQQIAKQADVNITFYANQGAVSDWVAGMQQAIAQKADLIILEDAPDPRQLQPQIKAAKAAGIPVLVTHFYDAQMPNPPECTGCAAGVTAVVKAPLTEAASAMADWTIASSKGNADVLIVTINGLLPIPGMISAEEKQYAENCPKCKVKVVSIDLSQLGNGAIGAVSTALAEDPSINYVNPMFDVLIPGTQAAVQTADKAGQVQMMSYNGSQFAMKDVATSSTSLKMDVAEPDAWIGYANMDQAFRLLAGMRPVTEITPLRVFDATNIKQAGASYTGGFGSAYVSGYRKLWGLS